jgi:hypothetical protein
MRTQAMRETFILPPGMYLIGDPGFVFTNMELWQTFQHAILFKNPSLIEGLDSSELELWNKLESILNHSFYAEVEGNKVWAAKTAEALKHEYSILGDGWFQVNTGEIITSCSGWLGITPLKSLRTHLHEMLKKNYAYISCRGEYIRMKSDISFPVTFDTDSGIFSFGLMEIDTRGKGLGLSVVSNYGVDTWETVEKMLEESLLDNSGK